MIAFLDASALVKLVVDEEGSDVAGEIWDAADLLVASTLAYPESCAALSAAVRAARLTSAAHRSAVRELGRRWDEIQVLELSDRLARLAGIVADRSGLRGADAVHLASAIQATGPDTVLVTWDRDLARAALDAGLHAAPA